MPHDVIATCPVCSGELSVTRLRCGDCGTVIEGEFGVGRFARLTREQTPVLESFLRSRGNLRDMERELGHQLPDRPRPGRGAHPRAGLRSARRARRRPLRGRGRDRHDTRRCGAGRRRRGRDHPGRTARDPRAAVPPRAERRGGRRGHPRPGEDPMMTETTTPVAREVAARAPAAGSRSCSPRANVQRPRHRRRPRHRPDPRRRGHRRRGRGRVHARRACASATRAAVRSGRSGRAARPGRPRDRRAEDGARSACAR